MFRTLMNHKEYIIFWGSIGLVFFLLLVAILVVLVKIYMKM